MAGWLVAMRFEPDLLSPAAALAVAEGLFVALLAALQPACSPSPPVSAGGCSGVDPPQAVADGGGSGTLAT